MSDFGSILAEFKENEEPESIVPLVDDADLRKGIVAWRSVSIKYMEPGDCQETGDADRWNWLWRFVKYDQAQFGVVAGVRGQDVGKLLSRLVGLRLIYPDGTIHKQAKQYLQTIIWSELKKFQPRQPSAPKPPEKPQEKAS